RTRLCAAFSANRGWFFRVAPCPWQLRESDETVRQSFGWHGQSGKCRARLPCPLLGMLGVLFHGQPTPDRPPPAIVEFASSNKPTCIDTSRDVICHGREVY